MGCMYGKVDWNEFESCMEESCSKLGLVNLNCEEISNVFHRYTNHFHLTKLQLSESLKELNIELTKDLVMVFDLFLECPKYSKLVQRQNLKAEYKKDYYRKLYSVKKLSTFAIILGQGKIKEKFKVLFLIYDIDASNCLSKWEISSLITDVMEISLEIIPEIGKIFYPTKESVINKQMENLVSMKQNFIDYFRYLILEDRYKEISCQEFLKIMHEQDLKFVLNHKSLRSFIMNNFKQRQKEFEVIKKEGEDFDTEREQYLKYSQTRKGYKRMTAQV
jgi:hypothetical protein